MRAVVDTNILVSGLLSAGGPPARVLAAVASGRLQPVVCQAIMTEYRSVLKRPRLRIRRDRSTEWLDLIELTADWVSVPRYTGIPPVADPDDWPFMAAAHVGGCPLITGNHRDCPARLGVRVLSAREWLDGPRRHPDEDAEP